MFIKQKSYSIVFAYLFMFLFSALCYDNSRALGSMTALCVLRWLATVHCRANRYVIRWCDLATLNQFIRLFSTVLLKSEFRFLNNDELWLSSFASFVSSGSRYTDVDVQYITSSWQRIKKMERFLVDTSAKRKRIETETTDQGGAGALLGILIVKLDYWWRTNLWNLINLNMWIVD